MAEEAEKGRDKSKDERVLERARKRFAMADEAEDENRKKELDDVRFAAASPDDNYQWPQDVLLQRQNKAQEGGPRPCLTMNPLPTHIRQVTNEQRMNRPQIKVRPVDDKSDKEVAKIFDGIIRHIQVASEADLAYDTACDWQVGGGEGYFRILTEYCDERSKDQEIVFAPIADRFKVYLDPIGLLLHPAGKKCRWGFIVEDQPKDEYEAEHGDEHPIDWSQAGTGDMLDWFPTKDTVRVAEYFELDQKPAKLLEWTNGEVTLDSEPRPFGVPAVENPKFLRKTKITSCIWRKMNGQHVLDEREMPTKYIPIVRVVGNQWVIEGKPIVSGLVRNAKDAVRMYNYNASMEVELNALAPRAPFVAMAEQIKGHEDMWRNANRVNYGTLLYNAVVDESTGQIVDIAPPARAQPAMPQAAIIAAKLAAADDIKKTTGQFDPSLGNNPQAKSGIALQREQVKSEVGTFHYVDNLARALRYAGTICVDMIPKVYTGKRIARILGEDGEPDHVVLDPSIQSAVQDVKDETDPMKVLGKVYRLDVGKYDVVVTTGPSFTTKRQEQAEFLTNVIQSTKDPVMAQVLTYLALKSNDWAGAEEATEMVKKLLPPGLVPPEGEQSQIPPEVEQAMGQVKQQLEAAMQAGQATGEALAACQQELKQAQAAVESKGAESAAKVREAEIKLSAEVAKAEGVKAQAAATIREAELSVEAARIAAQGTVDAAAPGNEAVNQMTAGVMQVCQDLTQQMAAVTEVLASVAQANAQKSDERKVIEIQAPSGAVYRGEVVTVQ